VLPHNHIDSSLDPSKAYQNCVFSQCQQMKVWNEMGTVCCDGDDECVYATVKSISWKYVGACMQHVPHLVSCVTNPFGFAIHPCIPRHIKMTCQVTGLSKAPFKYWIGGPIVFCKHFSIVIS
jgi:hypothetical protein